MKYRITIIILLLIVFKISAQHLDLIPRRIYLSLESNEAIASPLLTKLPDFLHAAISRHQPVVRVYTESEADSTLQIILTFNNNDLAVDFVLNQDGSIIKYEQYQSDRSITDYAAFSAFIDETALNIAPELTMVQPVYINTGEALYTRELLEKLRYLESISRGNEISLWALGGRQFFMNEDPVFGLSVFPLIFDYTSYKTRNRGIIYSFLIDYYNSSYLLPGIGIRFKNSAKLYAQTSLVFYAGAKFSSDSGAAFTTLGRVTTEIGYNISPQFSINALAGIYMPPIVFLFSIVPEEMMMDLMGYIQIFSLGVSYRF